jgi:hypothetical protein
MPDIDDGADAQDEAEIFDETNREDELTLGGEDLTDDPDVARDIYDVTSAIGDADDDRYAMDAADAGPEDLDGADFEDDEDDDDNLDNDLEDEPEGDEPDSIDDPVDAAAGPSRAGEPDLTYLADLDSVTRPRDDEAEKYESTRPLSDAQLRGLGYLNAASKTDPKETDAMDTNEHAKDRPRDALGEQRPFADKRKPEKEPAHGTGAKAEDVADETDRDEEARLDETLEETFPASDPVSAKHIT